MGLYVTHTIQTHTIYNVYSVPRHVANLPYKPCPGVGFDHMTQRDCGSVDLTHTPDCPCGHCSGEPTQYISRVAPKYTHRKVGTTYVEGKGLSANLCTPLVVTLGC